MIAEKLSAGATRTGDAAATEPGPSKFEHNRLAEKAQSEVSASKPDARPRTPSGSSTATIADI